MISAGRVLILPKGTFNASTAYEMLDFVSYQGSTYVAKKGTQGNLPTNSEYWQLMALGSSATNSNANFATIETSAISAHEYSIGEYLVNVDGTLCIVTDDIDIGDQIIIGSNVEITTVDAMVDGVKTLIEGVKNEAASLIPRIEISETVSLNTLVNEGEYYKSKTNFSVTDAPLEIDSISTAKFRLRVEKGTDNSKVIQTIRTDDCKSYFRSYTNSAWTAWIQPETKLTFDGTPAEWEELSVYERKLYKYVILWD